MGQQILGHLKMAEARQQLHGLRAQEAYNRLSYATFVGVAGNYLFTETPKGACTAMKWVLAVVERSTVSARVLGRETSMPMRIHHRENHGIKSLTHFDIDEFERLRSDSRVTRFCVVPNPYARLLVSSWDHFPLSRIPAAFGSFPYLMRSAACHDHSAGHC